MSDEQNKMPEWKRRVEAAHDAVSRLCNGEDWRMCVPVNPEADHDVIITGGLCAAARHIEQVEAAHRKLIEAVEACANLRDAYGTPHSDTDKIAMALAQSQLKEIKDAE